MRGGVTALSPAFPSRHVLCGFQAISGPLRHSLSRLIPWRRVPIRVPKKNPRPFDRGLTKPANFSAFAD